MYIAGALVILLTIMLILALYRQMHFISGLSKIINVLDEVLKNNFNRRFFAGEQENKLKYLAYKLNTLMEEYQNSILKNKNIEEMRKRMISDISHDIRTPLTSIQGYMEALQSDKSLSNNEKEETNIVILILFASLKINCLTSFIPIGSSPFVGSSRISNSG